MTGRVDGEGVRPLGFLLDGGTTGPQYVIRYKGVGATVADRDMAVSSTLARAVHVRESGGDTSIVVDLISGVELTPKLTRSATGFVLILESASVEGH